LEGDPRGHLNVQYYADIYLENRGKPEIFTSGKSLRSFARWG